MVGYRTKNLDDIQPIYHCPHCLLLLRDPVQLVNCGHRYCQSCLDDQQGEIITCFECAEKIPRENLILDRGFRNDMQTLSIICVLCNWIGVLKNYQNHLNEKHPNPTCSYCNEKFISMNHLNRHQKFTCDKIIVCCPLKPIGCEEMIPRVDLSKHYSSERHQRVLMNFILQTGKKNVHQTTYLITDHLEQIDRATNVLSRGIEALTEDIERLAIESAQRQNELQPILQKLPILIKAIDEDNTFVDSMKPNQENIEQDILSMKQKFDEIISISSDGTYIWKISNVQEKMAAAQSSTQTSIYSSPFYSSPTGYKCCLRLYLNGDGTAHQTHMSLFFFLMRGEYDAILKFPFCFKVIFCLYDQTNQQNHIIDVFKPDVISNSFHRPQSNMNNASGIPKFVSLKLLQQENNPYIRDDTMFIKAIIDFGDMPKAMLPYAARLNPALTNQIQQAMIREETEKRQQQQI